MSCRIFPIFGTISFDETFKNTNMIHGIQLTVAKVILWEHFMNFSITVDAYFDKSFELISMKIVLRNRKISAKTKEFF